MVSVRAVPARGSLFALLLLERLASKRPAPLPPVHHGEMKSDAKATGEGEVWARAGAVCADFLAAESRPSALTTLLGLLGISGKLKRTGARTFELESRMNAGRLHV